MRFDDDVLFLRARTIVPFARLELTSDEYCLFVACLQVDLDLGLWWLVPIAQKNNLCY
jgi:hypothetical protein